MDRKRALHPILCRTLSSLAAIAAISTIFGAKALESAQRAEAAETNIAANINTESPPRAQ